MTTKTKLPAEQALHRLNILYEELDDLVDELSMLSYDSKDGDAELADAIENAASGLQGFCWDEVGGFIGEIEAAAQK